MAKYKVLRFSDNSRGIGAVVERSSIFGKSIWVKEEDTGMSANFDIWINSETGASKYANIAGEEMDNFYRAQCVLKEVI